MTYLYFLTSTHPPRVKIGIGDQLKRRVNQVDRTTKGHQRVLIAFDMPFGARKTETYLHRRYSRWHAPLKHGSGKSEYFQRGLWLIEAISIAALACVAQWALLWVPIYFILLIFLHG
jgi:hypothetical protein